MTSEVDIYVRAHRIAIGPTARGGNFDHIAFFLDLIKNLYKIHRVTKYRAMSFP